MTGKIASMAGNSLEYKYYTLIQSHDDVVKNNTGIKAHNNYILKSKRNNRDLPRRSQENSNKTTGTCIDGANNR